MEANRPGGSNVQWYGRLGLPVPPPDRVVTGAAVEYRQLHDMAYAGPFGGRRQRGVVGGTRRAADRLGRHQERRVDTGEGGVETVRVVGVAVDDLYGGRQDSGVRAPGHRPDRPRHLGPGGELGDQLPTDAVRAGMRDQAP